MTQNPRFTGQDIYDLAKEGFLHELGKLVEITQSIGFRELLPKFLTYNAFLTTGKQRFFIESLTENLLKETRFIDASNCPTDAGKLFLCANLAACCEIFSGWTIPVNDLDMNRTNEYLEMALANAGVDKESLGRNMAQRLNNGDTVRVVQTLKLLGLLDADISSCHQISLGASIGRRDCHAMHLEPSIIPAGTIATSEVLSPLRFNVRPGKPADIILMDNDPVMKPVYDRLNTEGKGHIAAMVTDLYDGLGGLARQVEDSEVTPRTMVVAFRIEPRAFTDIDRFLDSIGKVIAESADFVMTIGSGDTTDEFRHRQDVLTVLNRRLSDHGMNPFRIKAYSGGNTEEQRANPVFGLNQYASYETLYCRLEKSKLDSN